MASIKSIEYLTHGQAAAVLGVSGRQLTNIIKGDNTVPLVRSEKRGEPHRYPAKRFGEWLIERKVADQISADSDIDPAEVARAVAQKKLGEARKEVALAELREIDVEVARQRYAPIDTMVAILAQAVGQARTRFEALPGLVRRRYPDLDQAVVDMIGEAAAEAASDIATLDADWEVLDARVSDA